jgi:hypothetical protein
MSEAVNRSALCRGAKLTIGCIYPHCWCVHGEGIHPQNANRSRDLLDTLVTITSRALLSWYGFTWPYPRTLPAQTWIRLARDRYLDMQAERARKRKAQL